MGEFRRFSHHSIEVAGFSPDRTNAELASVFAGQLGIHEEGVALYFDELRMAEDGRLWVARDAGRHRSHKPLVYAIAGTQTQETGTAAHPAKQTVFTALGAHNPEHFSTEAALAAIVHRSLGDGESVGPLDDIAAPSVPEALYGIMGRIGLNPVEVLSGGAVSMQCRASQALLLASGILFPPANRHYLEPPLGLPTLRH